MLLIDPIQPTDISACVEIMLANPLWSRYGVTAAGAEKMFRRALDENATILVARADGEVAGFNWYVTRGAWDRSGYIRLIGVSPTQQGKGVGEALMKAAEERMAETVSDVFLLVSDFNQGAQRFYKRLGYIQAGAIPDYVQQGIAELIFFKPLRKDKGL